MADSNGLGFGGGALVFGAAFVLNRPLGATAGDLLDKTTVQGGFELSRIGAFLVLIGAMLLLIVTLPPRAGLHPAQQRIN